jgi:hypothetical protein
MFLDPVIAGNDRVIRYRLYPRCHHARTGLFRRFAVCPMGVGLPDSSSLEDGPPSCRAVTSPRLFEYKKLMVRESKTGSADDGALEVVLAR